MGEPVKEMVSWARRQKAVAALFVALTLIVGILIGSVVSGRTSAMRSMAFSAKGATPLAIPDAIPSSNSFASIVNRVEPAVVNISTTQVMEKHQSSRKRRLQPADPQDGPNDPMQDFLDRVGHKGLSISRRALARQRAFCQCHDADQARLHDCRGWIPASPQSPSRVMPSAFLLRGQRLTRIADHEGSLRCFPTFLDKMLGKNAHASWL